MMHQLCPPNNEVTAHWSAKRQVFVPLVGSPHLRIAFVFTIVWIKTVYLKNTSTRLQLIWPPLPAEITLNSLYDLECFQPQNTKHKVRFTGSQTFRCSWYKSQSQIKKASNQASFRISRSKWNVNHLQMGSFSLNKQNKSCTNSTAAFFLSICRKEVAHLSSLNYKICLLSELHLLQALFTCPHRVYVHKRLYCVFVNTKLIEDSALFCTPTKSGQLWHRCNPGNGSASYQDSKPSLKEVLETVNIPKSGACVTAPFL